MKTKRTHSQRIKEGIQRKKLEKANKAAIGVLRPPENMQSINKEQCATPVQQDPYEMRRQAHRRGKAEGLSIALQAIAREITDL